MEWERIVGANVRRIRLSKAMTQEAVALAANVDLRYLGSIERGDGNPSVSVLGRLAAILEVHPSELFLDAGPQ